MPTKIYLAGRGKPPKVNSTLISNEKGSLGKVVFSGNCLKRLVWQPILQRTNGSRVPGKNLSRKRVYLKDRNFQANWMLGLS